MNEPNLTFKKAPRGHRMESRMEGEGKNKVPVIANFSDSDYSSDSSEQETHRIGSGLGVTGDKPKQIMQKLQFTAVKKSESKDEKPNFDDTMRKERISRQPD
jgi:hypothetical protein